MLHLSTVLQDAGFSGFSGLLGFEKKKKKKSVRTDFTKGISIPPKVLCAFPEVRTRMDAINKQQTTNKQRRGGYFIFDHSCDWFSKLTYLPLSFNYEPSLRGQKKKTHDQATVCVVYSDQKA